MVFVFVSVWQCFLFQQIYRGSIGPWCHWHWEAPFTLHPTHHHRQGRMRKRIIICVKLSWGKKDRNKKWFLCGTISGALGGCWFGKLPIFPPWPRGASPPKTPNIQIWPKYGSNIQIWAKPDPKVVSSSQDSKYPNMAERLQIFKYGPNIQIWAKYQNIGQIFKYGPNIQI